MPGSQETVNLSNTTSNGNRARLPEVGWLIAWNVMATLTVVFNLVNIIIISAKQRLRNFTHIIMASMFTADILFALTYLYPRFGHPSQGRDHWLYCTLMYNISPTIIISINLHLLAVSIDKLIAIESPVFYRKNSKPVYALLNVVAIWASSLILGFLPVMTFRPLVPGACIFWNMKEIDREMTYTVIHVILFYILPFIIMTFVYIRLFCAAKSFSLRLAKKHAIYHVHQPVVRQNSTSKRHYKTAKVLAILVSTYFVMWTPYYVYYLLFIFVPWTVLSKLRGIVYFLTYTRYMAFSYPAVNAILYGYLIKDVRITLYHCLSAKIRQDSLRRS
ncbi:uncharacterized protein TRIADDRAFT_61720 [Trichoplax adhaerens]|uniref:G-protein coupled receptors family 1 profile domain-containing protein n=1 Tax=Trichoplax adhaerens TaxID=10228 RepID=B3SBS6_TRIAD|nr:hypothetical protein TRIADDRAFT_61720 [Trichoplax adhaerens]EDV19845.1 hypothetical protein TRIADDRAFT_61720 [Trichoplax adhaerens]|eukprot:XP_002117715.1 hypothetical protein TRIADDRAFT_61720 [Trichoplax adhaerens]